MKIIQIGSYPLDVNRIKGGIEASVYGLSKSLSENHQVEVFDFPRKEIDADYIENFEKVKVWRFANKSSNNMFASLRIFSIAQKIKKERPDVCHIHSTSFFSLLMWILLGIYGLKLFVTIHGLVYIEQRNSWNKKRSVRNFVKLFYQSISEFLLLSFCKEIIVDTHYVEKAIKYYKSSKKIGRMPVCHIIPQGISEVFFKVENEFTQNHLLSVGAIGKRKGYFPLLEAIALVKKNIPGIKLTIAGSVNNASYFNRVKEKIKELDLEQNVEIKGNILFDELIGLYKTAGIFVLHSEEESQGIVLCEAMAVGLPIVATRIGGIPDVVKENYNGLLSPFSDVHTFAKNIITLLQDNNLRTQISISNKEEALKYNWKNITNEILKQYSRLK